MKKLSDFQSNNIPRTSMSIDDNEDENSSSEHSNSPDDESIDDSIRTSSDKTDQITVKVKKNLKFSIIFQNLHFVFSLQ